MYKVSDTVSDDVTLIVDIVNLNEYKIVNNTTITKGRGKTNLYDNVMFEAARSFKSTYAAVEAEFKAAWDSKDISIVSEYDGMECDIPKPIPALMPKEIIQQFNDEYNIIINPCTYEYSRITGTGAELPMSKEEYRVMLKTFVVAYNRCCKLYWEVNEEGKKVSPFTKYAFSGSGIAELEPQIELNNFEFERGARRQLVKKIAYDGSPLDKGLSLVAEYLRAMKVPCKVKKFDKLGLQNDYITICAYVLMHWMWLVKRNLMDNADTTEEIFINIFGGQGCGKSTFFENMGAILHYFYAEADIKKLLDDREVKLFANKRIVFFDEFGSKAKLNHDEMAALKKITTTRDFHQRMMRTTEHVTLTRKFTGCSATNINFSEIVKDETGARRFFEIITATEYSGSGVVSFDFDYLDSKKIRQENGKDGYVDIWKVVDETLEGGYMSMYDTIRDDIRKIQSTYVPLSSTLQFMTSEECTYVSATHYKTVDSFKKSVSEDSYQILGIQDLYTKYLAWCKSNNQEHAKTRSNFKRDIEDLDILISKRNKGNNSDGTSKEVNEYYVFTGV